MRGQGACGKGMDDLHRAYKVETTVTGDFCTACDDMTREDGSGLQVQSEEHFLKDQGDSVPGF